jgi:hypothetical protein
MARRTISPATRERARELVAAGASSREAAATILQEAGEHVDPRTIQRWTRDIEGRPDGRFKPRPDVSTGAVAAALSEGRSYAAVAGEMGISKSTAWRRANSG